MKKFIKFVSTVLAVTLTMTNIAFAKDYSDDRQTFWDVNEEHWAFHDIAELVDKGVINGYSDGSFLPTNTVSRAEWSKMLCIAGNMPTDSSKKSKCSDVNIDDWYHPYISVIEDYIPLFQTENSYSFKPNQTATREDVTVSIIKLKKYDVSNPDYSSLEQFSDSQSISADCKKYIAVAISEGVITGFDDHTFRGQDSLTRAEAATIICRAFRQDDENNASIHQPTPSPTTIPSPTKEPTPTPEPTPAPTSDTAQTPYKIETITAANKPEIGYYATGNDNFYYYDKKTKDIIKIDIAAQKAETIINADDISVTYNNITYTGMEIHNIFYDSYANSLVANGKFTSTEYGIDPLICLVELDTMNVVTFAWITNYIFHGTLSTGDYIVADKFNHYIHLQHRTQYNYPSPIEYGDILIRDYQEYNGNIYYIYSNVYDNTPPPYSLKPNINNEKFWGLGNHKLVNINDANINIYDMEGNKEKSIDMNNIKDQNEQTIDTSKIAFIYASSDNNLLYYDTEISAFRIISQND